jgi:hypothetical protein
MTSNDLTSEQGLKVYLEIREIRGYVYTLKARMDQRGFPPDGQVYVATEAAGRPTNEMSNERQRIACGPTYPL